MSRKLRVHAVTFRAKHPPGIPYDPTVSQTATHLMSCRFSAGGRASPGSLACSAPWRACLSCNAPQLFGFAEFRHLRNPGDRADYARECARGVSAAREAEDVDLVGRIIGRVACVIVKREEGEPTLDIALHSGAEHAAQEPIDGSAAAYPRRCNTPPAGCRRLRSASGPAQCAPHCDFLGIGKCVPSTIIAEHDTLHDNLNTD